MHHKNFVKILQFSKKVNLKFHVWSILLNDFYKNLHHRSCDFQKKKRTQDLASDQKRMDEKLFILPPASGWEWPWCTVPHPSSPCNRFYLVQKHMNKRHCNWSSPKVWAHGVGQAGHLAQFRDQADQLDKALTFTGT